MRRAMNHGVEANERAEGILFTLAVSVELWALILIAASGVLL